MKLLSKATTITLLLSTTVLANAAVSTKNTYPLLLKKGPASINIPANKFKLNQLSKNVCVLTFDVGPNSWIRKSHVQNNKSSHYDRDLRQKRITGLDQMFANAKLGKNRLTCGRGRIHDNVLQYTCKQS